MMIGESPRAAMCLLALAAAAAPARAQSAEADVLFREGKKLLKQGRIAEACEKLDASERLESSVGTLLNLADCHEKNHRLATAWATFRKAAVAAKKARDGKREKEARRRENLLTPRLSYLTVNVPEANLVAGLAITRNGVDFDRALWNQSVPIDAGDYDLLAAADGYVDWTHGVRIDREAQKVELDVPALSPRPRPAAASSPRIAPAPDADGASVTRGDAVRRDEPRPRLLTAARGVALGLAAGGVAGIAIGTIYGVRGRNLERKSDALCPTSTCNDGDGLSLNSDARRHARVANIGFGVGGGLVATAIVLWLVGGPPVAPVVAHDSGGIAFAGTF